jgi:hypothetical protein
VANIAGGTGATVPAVSGAWVRLGDGERDTSLTGPACCDTELEARNLL